MAIWLVRGGKYGEYEDRFFSDNKIYLTWDNLSASLSGLADRAALRLLLEQTYPNQAAARIRNWVGQIGRFVFNMSVGDIVVVPKKGKGTIAVGNVTSEYIFDSAAPSAYRHSRDVKWINLDVPRSIFDQDLLFSMGAFLTICEISRNNAETRIRKLLANNFSSRGRSSEAGSVAAPEELDTSIADTANVDIERYARDQIASFIIQKFKGHGLARLVEAVLKAQGYTTFLSPEGPDRGIDILAAKGPLGFDGPRICVQVKSGDQPTDRPELQQLFGAIETSGADTGLFVSWAGFKSSVYREVPARFFKVRLWDADELVEQLLENYENLDGSIRSELPFRRIWTLLEPDF